jgi:hypothetical protein
MKIEQQPTVFENIFIVLETPEDTRKFQELIEFATNSALANELDFKFGNKICQFLCSEAVIPSA